MFVLDFTFMQGGRQLFEKFFFLLSILSTFLTACAGSLSQDSHKNTLPAGATRIYAVPQSFLDKSTWRVILHNLSWELFNHARAYRPQEKEWCAPGRVCVTLTICADSQKTVCQTIDDIAVDTGSVGLRLSREALSPALATALEKSKRKDGLSGFGTDKKNMNVSVEYKTLAYVHGTPFDSRGPRKIYVMYTQKDAKNRPIFKDFEKKRTSSRLPIFYNNFYNRQFMNGILGIRLSIATEKEDRVTKVIADSPYKIVFSKSERSGYIKKITPEKASSILARSLTSKDAKKACCVLVDTGTPQSMVDYKDEVTTEKITLRSLSSKEKALIVFSKELSLKTHGAAKWPPPSDKMLLISLDIRPESQKIIGLPRMWGKTAYFLLPIYTKLGDTLYSDHKLCCYYHGAFASAVYVH